jgi:RNA polymerase sigma-70 factor (ECF subfamily)
VDDRVAFEDFFKAEQHRLLGALCLLTHDRIEAEEIDQDAFVRVWERWDRVGVMADPTGYLYRVAMNLFRSRYRRAERVGRLVLDHDHTADGLATVEDRDEVSRYLAQLIPQQRAAVVLTVLLDMTSEEAGRTLGLKASTVRVLTTRARASLRADASRDRS